MKKKVTIKDGNKTIERVIKIPDPDILRLQTIHHSHTHRNKKKFNRKTKYKQKLDGEI